MKSELPQAMYLKAFYPSQSSIRVSNTYNKAVKMTRSQDELTEYDSIMRTYQLYTKTYKNSPKKIENRVIKLTF